MGTGSALYRIVLLLHILAAIVGFGGVITHGFYNAKAFRSISRTAGELVAATRNASKIAEYAIYAVLPLGIVLVAVSDKVYSMGDPWVSASFLVWILMVGALHGAVRPAVKTLAERAGAISADTRLDTDAAALTASKKLMIGESATQVLVVIAIILMIWKPGS
ncbi:MAG: DUF2269 family protein [Acidimicrobiia bacterium]|nr:DUF2269 family protein [Acidimicrobiia bacterium]